MSDLVEVSEAIAPAKLLLVTHFNGRNEKGAPISERNNLIRALHNIAKTMQIPIFDPAAMLSERPQEILMAEGGRDLAHYADAAIPIVAEALYQYIVECTDAQCRYN